MTLSEDEAYVWRSLAFYRGRWVTGQHLRFHGFDARKIQEGKRTHPKESFRHAVRGLVHKISAVAGISPLLTKGGNNGMHYQLSSNLTIIDRRTGAEAGSKDHAAVARDSIAAAHRKSEPAPVPPLQVASQASALAEVGSFELLDSGNTLTRVWAAVRAAYPGVTLQDVRVAVRITPRAVAITTPDGQRTYTRENALRLIQAITEGLDDK